MSDDAFDGDLELALDSPLVSESDADAGADHVAAPPSGRVAVLIGAKGGCGTTLVAANLAMQSAVDRSTGLIDLDVGKGDLATYLDLEPGPAMGPLLAQLGAVDATMLDSALRSHPSGVRALLQPDALDQLHRLEAPDVHRLLRVARSSQALTFVDAGSRVDVHTLAAVLAADLVVLVTTPTVPSLRDARRLLALFARLRVPADRVRVVVNRSVRRASDEDSVATDLGVPVFATLPRDDDACALVDDRGVPLADAGRGSHLHREIGRLLSGLLREGDPVPVGLSPAPSRFAPTLSLARLAAWRTR